MGFLLLFGTASSTDLAKKIGAITKDNKIVVDEKINKNLAA